MILARKRIGLLGTTIIVGFLLTGVSSFGQLITYQLTVQPIHVTNGTNRANDSNEYYEAIADKIYAQAGVDLKFLPSVDYVNTTLYNGPANGDNSTLTPFLDGWNTATSNTSDRSFLRLFFVSSVGNGSLYGATTPSSYFTTIPKTANYGMGVFIADYVFSDNRLDTIAHEIGHALTLGTPGHKGPGNEVLAATNLMADGGSRTTPTSISNVYPSGTGTDQLLASQITRVNDMFNAPGGPGTADDGNSYYLKALAEGDQYTYGAVPEPSTWAFIVGGGVLLLVGFVRRRPNPLRQ